MKGIDKYIAFTFLLFYDFAIIVGVRFLKAGRLELLRCNSECDDERGPKIEIPHVH